MINHNGISKIRNIQAAASLRPVTSKKFKASKGGGRGGG